MLVDDLDIVTSRLGSSFSSKSVVVLSEDGGETELNTDGDFLSSGEFHTASSKSFNCLISVLVLGSDGVQDLVDLNSSASTLGLTESTSHTGLESIGTSA